MQHLLLQISLTRAECQDAEELQGDSRDVKGMDVKGIDVRGMSRGIPRTDPQGLPMVTSWGYQGIHEGDVRR